MEETRKPTIILASGGTGGHIFPSQALAETLLKKNYNVHWFTDVRGHGFNQMPEGVKTTILPINKTTKKGAMRIALTILSIAKCTFSAYVSLRKIKPDVVVGFGGYPSAATMACAILYRAPSIIHEQNAVLGRTNKILAKFTKRIALSFKNTQGVPTNAKPKTRYTGIPLRATIKQLAKKQYLSPSKEDTFNILVMGGSQGAKIFSDIVPAAVKHLPLALRKKISVRQQCREEALEKTLESFKKCKIDATVTGFIDNVEEELSKAHLVISRAGASTVSELIASKRPTILVPYPHATNNHQYYNALSIEDVKGGWLVTEDKFKPARLSKMLEALMTNPDKLTHASESLSHLYEESATDALAQEVENLLQGLKDLK